MARSTAGAPNDGDLPPDFADFILCLEERRVDVVLVGGYALAVYGVVRATGDIDFLYRRTRVIGRAELRANEEATTRPKNADDARRLGGSRGERGPRKAVGKSTRDRR